jgi:hypothetical protein
LVTPLEHDGINAETFADKQVVYQIGVAPVRIDILTGITGVEFSNAWKSRVAGTFFAVPVHFISLDDLTTNKQALGRSIDLKDLNQNSSRAKPEKGASRTSNSRSNSLCPWGIQPAQSLCAERLRRQ